MQKLQNAKNKKDKYYTKLMHLRKSGREFYL